MAMNYNPLSHLALRDETIDDLFLSQNTSNFYLNPVDIGGLTGSQFSHQLLHSNKTLGFDQNDLISPRKQPSIGLGELGLGQKVTEVRRTYVTPNRVQVHSIIEYSPLQNQLGFPPNEDLGFSKVTKTTRFLTPTSTMQRLFAPNYSVPNPGFAANDRLDSAYVQGIIGNNSVHFQRKPNFRNQILIPSNQLNHPTFNEIDPFLNSLQHQNRPLNLRPPRIFDLDDGDEATGNGVVVDPRELSGNASLNKGKTLSRYQNPSHERSSINIRNPNPCESSKNQNHNDDYDGRTHSLPCKKYGPYICPKCERVFDVSQTFAAHMWSHYKNETNAERKKRLDARSKKRNPPNPTAGSRSLNVETKVFNRKRKGHGKAITNDHEVEDELQKQGREAASAKAEKSDRGDMKKVKQESVAEKKIKEEPV